MSKDNSSFRSVPRTIFSSANENNHNKDSVSSSCSFVNVFNHDIAHQPPTQSPWRTPLNSIPDPSQIQSPPNSPTPKDHNEKSAEARTLSLDGQQQQQTQPTKVSNNRGGGGAKLNYSEPISAQSTPAKSHRVSNVGGKGSFSRPRGAGVLQQIGNVEPVVEVPHFELAQDNSFWNDYNVQVLIRIRPLNNVEKVSQGYGRCLRQESAKTLTWLGHPETRFTFDHIACETISQEKLFAVAGLPMVENCMSGYNSCMFAYGQTGSGKTYTMMGDISHTSGSGKLNEDCGITPRIFEYLFTRIREEENKRRSERLKYSCKCSFLEIYNEQITDLLEPSSNNLQLREDLKKGVYVENLTEYIVGTVDDVLRLLLQGAANRKMAATHMNSESSRSHSVFTCIIESRWEKDSMTHLRFGRLNLVDLAGSERQKSSGAEGDRLKEAANINKSLSTLGLVIMSLVDLAQGKQRHVPYRDSRLTFLLQDSLGGNSKTTIIANVSPSICSANETLSTLKFAQRAKLIQNNAKVNEDASGDVMALQRQIQQLKGQLSVLLNNSDTSKIFLHKSMSFKELYLSGLLEGVDSSESLSLHDNHVMQTAIGRKITSLKATLLGALRREKLAELEVKRLEAEIEQMNNLVHQLQEDIKQTKMILSFRDERINHLGLLSEGVVSADKNLQNENNALRAEIELLQSKKADPEQTQSAMENIKLLEQLKWTQDIYGKGEREMLLAEISILRDQVLDMLEVEVSSENTHISPSKENQENGVAKELRAQKNMNCKLLSKIGELQRELGNLMSYDRPLSCLDKVAHHRSDSADALGSYTLPEDGSLLYDDSQKTERALVLHSNDIQKDLIHAKSLIEAMELNQICLIEELELLKKENNNLREIFHGQGIWGNEHSPRLGDSNKGSQCLLAEDLNLITGEIHTGELLLQAKLEKLSKDLNKAQLLNSKYLEDHAVELLRNQHTQMVQAEVEIETTKTILHLQEEIATLHSELQGRLHSLEEENVSLRNCLASKESELKALCSDWERATFELTTFLLDGSKSLKDASSQIENITSLFPSDNIWISEHVERAAMFCIDKEESILLLKRSLEEAQRTVLEMEQKLDSLRCATFAFTEVQQMKHFETNIVFKEMRSDCQRQVEDFLGLKRDSDEPVMVLRETAERHLPLADQNALLLADKNVDIELTCLELLEAKLSCFKAENLFASIQSDMHEAFSLCYGLVQSLVNDIRDMRRNFVNLKENYGSFQAEAVGNTLFHSYRLLEHENEESILHQIRDELLKLNERLNSMIVCISSISNACESLAKDENPGDADGWTTDFSSSSYDSSVDIPLKSQQFVSSDCDLLLEEKNGQIFDQEFEDNSPLFADHQQIGHSQRLVQYLSCNGALLFHLRKELREAHDAFGKINAQLTAISCSKGTWLGSISDMCTRTNEEQVIMPEVGLNIQNHEQVMQATHGVRNFTRKADHFFTKFGEVQGTMEEADCILNALLKSNEDAKHLTSVWKQAGSDLMIQRNNLVEEIKHLRSSIHMRDSTNELLQDQIHVILREMNTLMLPLEGSFQQDVEDLCKLSYSDAILTVKETLKTISSLRSWVEDVSTKVRQDGIVSFLLHHCYSREDSNKVRRLETNLDLFVSSLQEEAVAVHSESQVEIAKVGMEECQIQTVQRSEAGECEVVHDDLITENLELKRELKRKRVLLNGLLFDLSLLQESASSRKDAKDEAEKLIVTLNQVQNELKMKTNQLDDMRLQYARLEGRLTETESSLSVSNFDLEQARGTLDGLSEKNAELTMLLKDIYQKKSDAEHQLQEHTDTIKDLENEILRMASSAEENLVSSLKGIKDDMARVITEKDFLIDQIQSLQDKLNIAYAVADEKEAIILEARQESEASKEYAEQKEEEVKILEHSVEELETTINMLEKKVYEMEEEVERHREIRNSLEVELHDMRERLLMVENMTEDLDSHSLSGELSANRSLRKLHEVSMELRKAHNQIRSLEKEKEKLVKGIKQYQEYVSELVMHAEAQASQYQQKYKNLELMVHEVTTDSSKAISEAPMVEKTSVKPRGSSSPFRCISNLVQQMNLEKDQELEVAKLRIEELEALVASKQKEICFLNTRLASVESMTHDVIRDLLGVKLDITNYSDLVSENRLQKLLEEAQQQAQQYIITEKEISKLQRQINDLVEERECCMLEVKRRDADLLATCVSLEQVRERDQLLTAQNELLKADKTSLQRKVAELDDMVKMLLGTPTQQLHNMTRRRDSSIGKMN